MFTVRSTGRISYPNNNLSFRSLNKKRPYCCPVCQGSGNVPKGFYGQTSGKWYSDGTVEVCRSCYGEGIVWN